MSARSIAGLRIGMVALWDLHEHGERAPSLPDSGMLTRVLDEFRVAGLAEP